MKSKIIVLLVLCLFIVDFTSLYNDDVEVVQKRNITTNDIKAEVPKQKTEKDVYNEIISGNPYKEFIYYHESGFKPENVFESTQALNESSMAYGICQINLEVHEPQNKYQNFYNSVYSQDKACTDYMESRYGTWDNAYLFWLNNGWW